MKGAKVSAYDPVAMENARRIFGNKIDYSQSIDQCLTEADCCIVVTEWKEFQKLNPEHFIKLMRNPVLIDGRKIYDSQAYSKKLKFRAIGLGKS